MAPAEAQAATTTHLKQSYNIAATLNVGEGRLRAVERVTLTNRAGHSIDHVNLSRAAAGVRLLWVHGAGLHRRRAGCEAVDDAHEPSGQPGAAAGNRADCHAAHPLQAGYRLERRCVHRPAKPRSRRHQLRRVVPDPVARPRQLRGRRSAGHAHGRAHSPRADRPPAGSSAMRSHARVCATHPRGSDATGPAAPGACATSRSW